MKKTIKNDLAENLLNKAIEVITPNPLGQPWQLAIAGGTLTGAAILAAWVYYELSKAPKVQPLSDVDQQRHHELLTIFKSYFPDYGIPDIWQLTDNVPRGQLNFVTFSHQMRAEATRLNRFNTLDHNLRMQLFSEIGRLFQSISKRSVADDFFNSDRVRDDGIEVMFYSQLVFWLERCAPNYPPNHLDTLAIYEKMRDYCRDVQLKIITAKSWDATRNNPHATLGRIFNLLNNHYLALRAMQDANNFDTHINRLKDSMLGLASQGFNLIYLLLDGVTETIFIPHRFLNLERTDKKLKIVRQTQLGQWLLSTLDAAGIDHTTYVPTKMLTREQVKYHLQNEHPDDEDYVKPRSPLAWGERPFTALANEAYQDGNKKASAYRASIRGLLRWILEIFLIVQQQMEAAKANEIHGAIWIYGQRAGKATLIEFLRSVDWVAHTFMNEIRTFWQQYYTEDFHPYTLKHNLDTREAAYQPLIFIETELMKVFNKLEQNLRQTIQAIEAQAEQFPTDEKINQQSKLLFMHDVLEYRMHIKQTNSSEFAILQEEYRRLINQIDTKPIASESPTDEVSFAPRPPKHAQATHLPQAPRDSMPTPTPRVDNQQSLVTTPVIIDSNRVNPNVDDVVNTPKTKVPIALNKSPIEPKNTPKGPIVSAVAAPPAKRLMTATSAVTMDQPKAAVMHQPASVVVHTTPTLITLANAQLPLCNKIFELLSIPKYHLELKTSSLPLINQYCFEYKNGTLQYSYLNATKEVVIKKIIDKKALERLGGNTFKCDNEHLRRYRRELIAIINPKALARLDYESQMHTRLLTKPEPFNTNTEKQRFYSPMQETIYTDFLKEYNDVVNTAQCWTYLRVSNHPLLVDLYQRVNAVFHLLYTVRRYQLSVGEVFMIDTVLHRTIMDEFNTHQFFSSFRLHWEAPVLNLEHDEEELKIPLNELVLGIAREPIRQVITEAIGSITEKETKIDALTAEKALIKAEVDEKTHELETKQTNLDEKDLLIAKLKEEIENQKKELVSKNEQILSKNEQIESKNKHIDSIGAQLAVEKKLKLSQAAEIDSLQKILTTMQQREEEVRKARAIETDVIANLNEKIRLIESKFAENPSSFFTHRNTVTTQNQSPKNIGAPRAV